AERVITKQLLKAGLLLAALYAAACSTAGKGPTTGRRTITVSPISHPLDLVTPDRDSNDFLFNPWWRAQDGAKDRPIDPISLCQQGFADDSCTSSPFKPSLNVYDGPVGVICQAAPGTVPEGKLRGHANWATVTYTGRLTFDEWSADFDFNLAIKSDTSAGETSANVNGVALEFLSEETVKDFQTPWWKALHDAVQEDAQTVPQTWSGANALVGSREAVAVGLLGLDCVHECRAELHPLYALLVHADSDSAADHWAVFARNSGSQGTCSSQLAVLERAEPAKIVLKIEWRKDSTGNVATAAQVISDRTQFLASRTDLAEPVISIVPQQGIFLTFDGLRSGDADVIEGDLFIKWNGIAGSALPVMASPGVGSEARLEAERRTVSAGSTEAPRELVLRREDRREISEKVRLVSGPS